ncbi:HvfX family Cu-binding RiPP maturation protein [Flocculibacter collagenilyticus]|uniref:HvfX family Cu-binding RiPP maturation protein n=1 Tax=Flocculibacter collagenilyticus TaxID=2744479 RepID=UPI0018F40A6F|nr:DoxX family protein [Flocculibacter collagenilyticus]
MLKSLSQKYDSAIHSVSALEGIAPLLMRLYLAPIMIQAGWNKLSNFSDTAAWFGNAEWGLGLPMPELMAGLAATTEFVGGFLILIGLFTRLISIPLMFTMLVAAVTVHLKHGWLAIADASSWLADGTIFYNKNIMEAPEKVEAAKSLLQEHGNYEWLTSSGNFVILNNGIEFAATYFIMFLALFFYGGGKFTSVDYFMKKQIKK